MVENRIGLPKAPIEERIVNSLVFPLQHLESCIEQLRDGAVITGEALEHLRQSNRVCRSINIGVAVSGRIIGTALVRSTTDGVKGKLLRASGVLILEHAANQAKAADEKLRMQGVLNSKDSISKHDL